MVYEGGFHDGIQYAIISQNLAHNIGDFWQLQWLNKTPFFEHPPLFFFIESLFFRLFGDGFWVGNLFVFFLAITVLILLHLIVQQIAAICQIPLLKKHSWLILLLWISANNVANIFNNNMLETLCTVWTLLAFYLILRYYNAQNYLKYLFLTLASAAIFCAYLTKGPVGLYPLATPFLYGLAFERKKCLRHLLPSLSLTLLVVLYFSIAYKQPSGRPVFFQKVSRNTSHQRII